MCMKNFQPVNGYCSPCSNCSEFLTTCMPVVIDGFLFGECDMYFCEFCNYYEECSNQSDMKQKVLSDGGERSEQTIG